MASYRRHVLQATLSSLQTLEQLIKELLAEGSAPDPFRGLIMIAKGKVNTMSFNITEGQKKTATVVYTDASGTVRPLAPGNVPVWACTPPAALALTPAADGMSCDIVGGTGDGALTLTATAEGDPTPGVDTIVATIAGTLVAPEDTQGTITVA